MSISTEMTKERALQILNSRKLVNGPGKYQVKVTSVHPYDGKHIVNISAMNMYQAKLAKADYASGEFQKACNSNLSVSVFENQTPPTKGSIIEVFIDSVQTKSGDVALLVTSWNELKVNTEIVNFDFTGEEVGTEEFAASENEFENSKA